MSTVAVGEQVDGRSHRGRQRRASRARRHAVTLGDGAADELARPSVPAPCQRTGVEPCCATVRRARRESAAIPVFIGPTRIARCTVLRPVSRRFGLSRRRSRVRVPSLPSFVQAVCGLWTRARNVSEPSTCQVLSDFTTGLRPGRFQVRAPRVVLGTTEVDDRGVELIVVVGADRDFQHGHPCVSRGSRAASVAARRLQPARRVAGMALAVSRGEPFFASRDEADG